MIIIRKTFRIARGTALVLGIAVMLALALGVATSALAAVPGDPFRLGKVNVINALTQLVGEKPGPMLRIDNNGATGSALQLLVEPNRPPLTVNADSGKAVNLNADELDDKDSSRFAAGVNGKATNADKLDGLDSSAFAGTGMSQYAGSTSPLEGCSEKVLLSSEISPSRPALVYASGVSVYEPSGGAMGGNLQLQLLDATETTTLASGGNMYANGGGNAVPLSAQGVLMSGSDVYTASTPFEVTPGNSYVLRLVGNATDGCSGSTGNYGSMEYVALSYLLIGK